MDEIERIISGGEQMSCVNKSENQFASKKGIIRNLWHGKS
jgi:lysophospholipid acyltransferase (LPLAT)-like uncharacterized protein